MRDARSLGEFLSGFNFRDRVGRILLTRFGAHLVSPTSSHVLLRLCLQQWLQLQRQFRPTIRRQVAASELVADDPDFGRVKSHVGALAGVAPGSVGRTKLRGAWLWWSPCPAAYGPSIARLDNEEANRLSYGCFVGDGTSRPAALRMAAKYDLPDDSRLGAGSRVGVGFSLALAFRKAGEPPLLAGTGFLLGLLVVLRVAKLSGMSSI